MGSGILDSHGKVNKRELARLAEFAKDKLDVKGSSILFRHYAVPMGDCK